MREVSHFENIKRHISGIISTHMQNVDHVAEKLTELESYKALWATVPLPHPLRGSVENFVFEQILGITILYSQSFVNIP